MNRNPNDKIFDNIYNKGEVDYQIYNTLSIDSSIRDDRNDYDKFRDVQLYELLDEILSDTKWECYKSKNKKISKFEISEYFQYMRSNFTDTTYSEIEIFIKIADIVNINYKVFYDMIPNQYKRLLLDELNKDYDIKNKIKTLKLF